MVKGYWWRAVRVVRVEGRGLRFEGWGIRTLISGFRVQCVESRIKDSGFRVQGLVFRA